MNYDASSTLRLAPSRSGLLLPFAVVLGFGLVTYHQSAFAGTDLALKGEGQPVLQVDAKPSGAIVLAMRDERDGKQGGHGHDNWHKGNNDWRQSEGKNWNKGWGNNDWHRGRNGNKDWNSGKNWSKNYNNHWGNGWSNYNNNWNRNWNNRGYTRDWSYRPYYGQLVGGVILGSLLAANGVGVIPYAPEPYLCWYWADPYMYRGYWDYCE